MRDCRVPTFFIDDPEYWRKWAEEARTIAERMTKRTRKVTDAECCRKLREDRQVGGRDRWRA